MNTDKINYLKSKYSFEVYNRIFKECLFSNSATIYTNEEEIKIFPSSYVFVNTNLAVIEKVNRNELFSNQEEYLCEYMNLFHTYPSDYPYSKDYEIFKLGMMTTLKPTYYIDENNRVKYDKWFMSEVIKKAIADTRSDLVQESTNSPEASIRRYRKILEFDDLPFEEKKKLSRSNINKTINMFRTIIDDSKEMYNIVVDDDSSVEFTKNDILSEIGQDLFIDLLRNGSAKAKLNNKLSTLKLVF